MYYYQVALLAQALEPLTYHSKEQILIGTLVQVPIKSTHKEGVVTQSIDRPPYPCLDIHEITPYYLPKSRLAVADFIANYYSTFLSESLKLFYPYSKDSVTQTETRVTDIQLTKKQQEAYDFILQHPTALLFGDTGSGKTEIYMKLFEKMIAEGKSSIFLLPEISLTPQMQQRLEEKFGDMVAIWHSKLAKKKRETIMQQITDGVIKIVAGARSALFLPLQHLGLIVVDEEHDDSYKSAQKPRYNARDIAQVIAKHEGAHTLLSSATPSLTSYTRYPTFRLDQKYFDQKTEYLFEDSPPKLSPLIKANIHECIQAGFQAIIFLPIRANFKVLLCDHCGETLKCPYCDVGMSLHRANRYLKCHYCNYTESIPQQCPTCKEGILKNEKFGTSQIKEELQEQIPNIVIEKFDRDEITTDAKLKSRLKAFQNGKIDLLVGTQMLSKGHDYHNVRLAVIMGIDYLLHSSDYRAREKAVAMMNQVAGRSGRKGEGRVIIQSKNCDYFRAYINRYETFLQDERPFRQELYPPYKKLMKIVTTSNRYERAQTLADTIHRSIKDYQEIEVVGFGEAPIGKLKGKYRYNILLRSDKATPLLKAAKIANQLAQHKDIEIDIDPVSYS
jgi:primosomal protein N' (replication factor Y)